MNNEIPVRQDIVVLPADKHDWTKFKEGDVEYETYGDYTVKYIYTKDDELLEQTAKLIRDEELKLVDRSVHIHDLETSKKDR